MPTLIRILICLVIYPVTVCPNNLYEKINPSAYRIKTARQAGMSYHELKAVLKSAKSATVFVFQPGQTGLKPLDSLAIQGKQDLGRKAWKHIKKSMLIKSGYEFSMFKNCLFHPAVGLRLHTKNGAFDMLMDFTCDTWYLHDNKSGFRQFEADGAHDAILEHIHVLFPETRAWQKTSRQ